MGTPNTQRTPERAVLIGVEPSSMPVRQPGEPALVELAQLAKTAGAAVVGSIVQRRARPDIATYIGKGKVAELKELCLAEKADVVIADDDLSPAQGRKLEKALDGIKVIDRTQLILDIFARHARTRQARLQVELALLEYTLPRLKRMWTHLERLGGGIGTRGPGETQIESDRRIIRDRLGDARRELVEIKARREREVAARADVFAVSLVGYTNAGKSTLHHALTASGVLAEDKLFATLDTKTTAHVLPGGGRVLLSDTVGFIAKLPHHLVECFHATLEEARMADLLLHVIDASHPEAEAQVATVERVLGELGLSEKPVIRVLNKVDQLRDPLPLTLLEAAGAEHIRVSARTGEGLEALEEAIQRRREAGHLLVDVVLPATAGRAIRLIEEEARVQARRYADDGARHLRVMASRATLGRLARICPEAQVAEVHESAAPQEAGRRRPGENSREGGGDAG